MQLILPDTHHDSPKGQLTGWIIHKSGSDISTEDNRSASYGFGKTAGVRTLNPTTPNGNLAAAIVKHNKVKLKRKDSERAVRRRDVLSIQ